jgi:hypothetical protein
MDGMRLILPLHFHGAMSANATFRWQLPCPLILVEVSAVASNDSDAKVKIGTTSNDDAYKTLAVIGDSGTPVIWDRGDFDGDGGHDTAECPHIAADTVLLVTVDYDGTSGTAGADVSIVLTFTEG